MPKNDRNARRKPGGRSAAAVDEQALVDDAFDEAQDPLEGAPRLAMPWSKSNRAVPRAVIQPLQQFMHLEAATGILLLVAAAVALVWANSGARESYQALIETHLVVDLGVIRFDESVGHWINDLLMAVFFFVVGLEIKREIVHGDLRDPRTALLPLVCALGGMVAPALIYAAFNAGGPGASGWGVPMATDIAFAVGVLSLVGARAPTGLKVFLLTLAVADDIGAIVVIALFYTSDLEAQWLLLGAGVVAGVVVMQRLRIRSLAPYVISAGVLWLAFFESGVHATLSGVILGLLTPARPFHPPEAVTGAIATRVRSLRARAPDGRSDETEQSELQTIERLSKEAISPLQRLEHQLHPWSSFLVLPLFAFANAGVELSGSALGGLLTQPVTLGVVLGLVVGKPLGIMAAAAIAVSLKQAKLPRGVGWIEMLGVGSLAGVGFTVAIFVSGLAFTSPELADQAKVGIFIASLTAAIVGAASLAVRKTT